MIIIMMMYMKNLIYNNWEYKKNYMNSKLLNVHTHFIHMGVRNKVIKLTEKKVSYIIQAKTKNDSNKNISREIK